VTSGHDSGRAVSIDRELTLGREGADLSVAGTEMSRQHFAVRPLPKGVAVRDLGSTNGTIVDGQRTVQATATVTGGTREFKDASGALSLVAMPETLDHGDFTVDGSIRY
jgi:pSer/pThr/pTyr-binding forkhead associated (FHA) protein